MSDATTQGEMESDDRPEIVGTWELAREQLSREFPNKKEGILFCIWKLRQDARTKLADFRDEAKVRGVSIGGRSLHSAKVALGWEEPSKRRSKAELQAKTEGAPARPRGPRLVDAGGDADDLESQLLANVQRIRAAASGEAARLKEAIREAIRVLQSAIDDDA